MEEETAETLLSEAGRVAEMELFHPEGRHCRGGGDSGDASFSPPPVTQREAHTQHTLREGRDGRVGGWEASLTQQPQQPSQEAGPQGLSGEHRGRVEDGVDEEEAGHPQRHLHAGPKPRAESQGRRLRGARGRHPRDPAASCPSLGRVARRRQRSGDGGAAATTIIARRGLRNPAQALGTAAARPPLGGRAPPSCPRFRRRLPPQAAAPALLHAHRLPPAAACGPYGEGRRGYGARRHNATPRLPPLRRRARAPTNRP